MGRGVRGVRGVTPPTALRRPSAFAGGGSARLASAQHRGAGQPAAEAQTSPLAAAIKPITIATDAARTRRIARSIGRRSAGLPTSEPRYR